mgnify:CR=1 FL=1
MDGGIPYNQKTMIQVRWYIQKVKEKEIKKKRKKRITLSKMELAFIWHSESGGIPYVFVEELSTPE